MNVADEEDMTHEANADLDEVKQDYDPVGAAVPVVHQGPVLTHELPSPRGIMRSFNITPSGERLLGKDRRVKSRTIWCENQGIYLATAEGDMVSGAGAHLPAGGSVTLGHSEEIWVRSDHATLSALVSIVVESWTG